MPEWLMWFTRMENSKIVALVLFFVTFSLIILYVYSGKSRKRRLESYKYIPLNDPDEPGSTDSDNSSGDADAVTAKGKQK